MFRHQDCDPKWIRSRDMGRYRFLHGGHLEIQDGCHNVSGESGSYQKWKAIEYVGVDTDIIPLRPLVRKLFKNEIF